MAKKKKHKGHYCRICGEYKANEKFSGKGHAQHICKTCMYHINDNEPLPSENIVYADCYGESDDMDYDMFNPDIDIMPPVNPKRKRFKKLNREEKAALKGLWTDIVGSYWEDEYLIPIGEAYSRLKNQIISIFAEEGEIMLVDDNELKTVLRDTMMVAINRLLKRENENRMPGDEGVAEPPKKIKQKPQLSQAEAFLCP